MSLCHSPLQCLVAIREEDPGSTQEPGKTEAKQCLLFVTMHSWTQAAVCTRPVQDQASQNPSTLVLHMHMENSQRTNLKIVIFKKKENTYIFSWIFVSWKCFGSIWVWVGGLMNFNTAHEFVFFFTMASKSQFHILSRICNCDLCMAGFTHKEDTTAILLTEELAIPGHCFWRTTHTNVLIRNDKGTHRCLISSFKKQFSKTQNRLSYNTLCLFPI